MVDFCGLGHIYVVSYICLRVFIVQIAIVHISFYTAGSDFIPGRYNATFTPGSTTATANITILAGNNSEEIKQFSLRLFIDGAAYQQCIFSGSISTATVSILTGIYCQVIHC